MKKILSFLKMSFNWNYTAIIILSLLFCFTEKNKVFGQAIDPGRGLYVNNFFTLDASDGLVNEFSVLAVDADGFAGFEKEDALLSYADKNHYTYLILFNLPTVFGKSNTLINSASVSDHLRRFIKKAKNQYHIVKIGANISDFEHSFDVDFYNNLRISGPTNSSIPFFTTAQTSSNSSEFQYLNNILNNTYNRYDAMFSVQKFAETLLLIQSYSSVVPADERIDVLSIEYEYWNGSGELYFKRFKQLTEVLYRVKVLSGFLLTEAYIDKLYDWDDQTGNTNQAIANYLDGQVVINGNTVKRYDRILLTYYTTNPELTGAGVAQTDYYSEENGRLASLEAASTTNGTQIKPLFGSGYIGNGSRFNYYGKWFNIDSRNNIFEAERIYWQSRLADPTYQPASTSENVIDPGGNIWYTSSYQIDDLPTPMGGMSANRDARIFRTESPYCLASVSSTTSIVFEYTGPIEASVKVYCTLKDVGTNTVFSSWNDITSSLTTPTAKSIPDHTVLSVPVGDYKLETMIVYDGGITSNYLFTQEINVTTQPIVYNVTGNNIICEGQPVILRSSKSALWYKGDNNILTPPSLDLELNETSGVNQKELAINPSILSIGANEIYYVINSGTCTGSATQIINVIENPDVVITATQPQGNGVCNNEITYTASSTPACVSCDYVWTNGMTGSPITVNEREIVRLIRTDNTTGCINYGYLAKPSAFYMCDNSDVNLCDNSIYSVNSITNNTIGIVGGALTTVSLQSDYTLTSNLTLTNVEVSAAADASIIVPAGFTLNIDNSSFAACASMWEGIKVESGATLYVDNSNFHDALRAIKINNNNSTSQQAVFHIDNSIFDHNNVGVQIEDGDFTSSYIRHCTFDCSNGLISKSPIKFDLSSSHINLNNVSNFTLGLAGAANLNTFKNAYVAVNSFNSKFTLVNNSFDWQSDYEFNSTIKRYAIYADNNSTYSTDYKITVGGNSGASNSFSNWIYGSLIYGANEVDQEFNTYNNCYYVSFLERCRKITFNDNLSTTFYRGLHTSQCDGSIINVLNNSFNLNQVYDLNKYGYEAIRLENLKFSNNAYATVQNNKIYNTAVGIHVSNMDGAQINTDNIYETSITNSDLSTRDWPHYGIRLENCLSANIEDNFISRVNTGGAGGQSGLGQQDLIKGISIETSGRSQLVNNTTTNMGTDIRVFGDCMGSEVRCNRMFDSYQGINFISAVIVYPSVTQYGSAANPSDNSWQGNYLTSTNSNLRITGSFASGIPINWYHRGSLAANNKYCPYYSAQFITPISNANSSSFACHLMSPVKGDVLDIAEDVTEYDELEDENKHLDELYAYKMLRENNSLMAGSGSDEVFLQQWYAARSQENVGKLEDVRQYIEQKNKQQAQLKNMTVVDNTLILENQKLVNEIFIDKLMDAPNGTQLDAASKNTLETIAYQNAATGGPGVYMARALLHLDVEDILNIGSRKANKAKKEETIAQISNSVFVVSPNPNDGQFYLDYILDEKLIGNVLIQDLSGRELLSQSLSSQQNIIKLNCETLQSGYYLLKVFEEKKEVFSTKIIIVK